MLYYCGFVGLLLANALAGTFCFRCDKTPQDVGRPRTTSEGEFSLEIYGDPTNYSPGNSYKIILKGATTSHEQRRFTGFLIIVEPNNPDDYIQYNNSLGTLQLYGDMLTKYSERCPNAVEHTNSIGKTQVQVTWIAPANGSGCVAIRATVVESSDKWYSEDGDLTKVLCEESQDNEDVQPPVLQQCCACHEAKYEVTFEGLWSRNTHPKDFPKNNWMTRFSDIIGASHTVNYTFWNYGGYASKGLKQLAENGNTRELETELKDKSEHIRTIIKARGISYPNITGKTFAVFRVDKRHHLMSLVSMIHPSPDWIVGVSGLELCLKNCSWVETKVLNLYPWDAGTDDGKTYISKDSPSDPLHPIRRITSNWPTDKDSPFYDETGAEMKPLARLILSRQRLYEKNCNNDADTYYIDPSKTEGYCDVTDWSEWSSCSAKCGKGMRHKQRRYRNQDPDYARQQSFCKMTLTKRSSCTAETDCYVQVNVDEECEPSPWSPWSGCSATCGYGTKTRNRNYKSKKAAKACPAKMVRVQVMQQNAPCKVRDCEPGEEEMIPEECEERAWSDWSPCSVTCGKGVKIRKKLPFIRNPHYQRNKRDYREGDYDRGEEDVDEEFDPCDDIKEVVECESDSQIECEESPNSGWNLPSEDLRSSSEVVDCEVTDWTGWSACDAQCGRGYKYKRRYIIREPQNDGKKCPQKLLKKKGCKVHCNRRSDKAENRDCVMGEWTRWSPCSHTCGSYAVRQRTRNIKIRPSGNGKPCSDRIEYEPCNLSACLV